MRAPSNQPLNPRPQARTCFQSRSGPRSRRDDGMLVLAAGLRTWLGEAGVTGVAVVAGFVDIRAAAISIASLAASDKMTPQEAVLPILAAMTSNTVAKLAMAIGGGSRGFALRIAPGLVAPNAVAWAVAALTALR